MLTSCITAPSCNSCFPIHITYNNIPFPPQPHIYKSWHHPPTHIVKHLDQISNHTLVHHSAIAPNLPRSLAQTNRSRSGEGVLSLRRNPSRLGEITKGGEWTLRGLAQASPFLLRRYHFSLKK